MTTTPKPRVIGTRGSALALWQANHVAALLRARFPEQQFAVKPVRTRGDVVLSVALAEIGARGIFVKELQDELLAGQIDFAIHSLKDLPSEDLPGTVVAAVSAREDPRDVLVSRLRTGLTGLPPGARVGSSSPRRGAQVLRLRPDLVVENIRGNVDTRVRKAREGDFDAVVLAAAGLHRLGLQAEIDEYFDLSAMLPAPGQGIVAVETREGDAATLALAAAIDDVPTHLAARAERAFVRAFGGGCFTPIAAHAVVEGSSLRLAGLVCSLDGRVVARREVVGPADEPEAAGTLLADRVRDAGGAAIMAALEAGARTSEASGA